MPFELSGTNADSPEARVDALGELKRFLSHAGLEERDPTKRIEWLKNTDPQKILDVLSVINGQLRGTEKFQRWEGQGVKSIVGLGGNSEFAEMEPPEHAEKEFEKLIVQIQNEINEENFPTEIAKLYTGIIYSHMFADGNGRTARAIYGLLKNGALPDAEHFAKRNPKITTFANDIDSAAMALLFKHEGVTEKTDGSYRHYDLTTDGICIDVMTNYLKYLAARRATKQTEGPAPEVIEFDELSPEQKADFVTEYANLRRDFFWSAQEVVTNHPEPIIAAIEEALSTA